MKITGDTNKFCHLDIQHLHADDYLRLKDETEFWVMHLHHEDGMMLDLSIAYDRSGRDWLIKKNYTHGFVYETLERIPDEYDWVLFTKQGEQVEGLEVHEWKN
jgi:hypothetical protein